MTDDINSKGLNRRDWMTVGAGAVAFSALACSAPEPAAAVAGAAPLKVPADGLLPVAFIMDQFATMIDFAGPYEAFQDASGPGGAGFLLYTVSGSRTPMRISGAGVEVGADGTLKSRRGGMVVTADFTFADAPQPRVVVMGAQSNHSAEKIAWIQKVAPQADIVMSICTGAFLLAKTGLIDGMQATTHHDFFDSFATQFPKVTLVRGRRFVDNGKYISGGGLTSGVDAALHVVARYFGEAVAQRSADYMEHYGDDWRTGVARKT